MQPNFMISKNSSVVMNAQQQYKKTYKLEQNLIFQGPLFIVLCWHIYLCIQMVLGCNIARQEKERT